MVWYNLQLGEYPLRITPINVKTPEYPYCDIKGEEVEEKKVAGTRGKTTYVDKNGNEIPRSQLRKLVNGKPISKFRKTEVVGKFEVLEDNSIIHNFLERKYYFVDTASKQLKELILKQRKALAFLYTSGNGYKLYRAILTYFQDKLLMVCGIGNLQKAIEQYGEADIELEVDETQQLSEKEMEAFVEV